MIKKTIGIMVMLSVLFIFSTAALAQEKEDSEGYSYEEVDVVNVEVPVRVLMNNQTVQNLKKEDFQIFEDGKEKEINGFYMVTKKIAGTSTPTEEEQTAGNDIQSASKAGLFLLIFNISDYNTEVSKGLDQLFSDILRPGDRFMVLSNSFTIHERVISNIAGEKANLINTLKKETTKIKVSRSTVEISLRQYAVDLFRDLDVGSEKEVDMDYIRSTFRFFFDNYIMSLNEYKENYFQINLNDAVQISQYLKSQDAEKWVLSFYQKGFFPRPGNNGPKHLKETITRYAESDMRIHQLYSAFLTKLEILRNSSDEDIARLFLNTGATFHTLIMNPRNIYSIEYYDYDTVSTNCEEILRNLTAMTGGKVMHSLQTNKFVAKITDTQDTYYVLTYVPSPKRTPKSMGSPIQVVLKNHDDCNIVYDDQSHSRYINKLVAKANEKIPHIKVDRVEVTNGLCQAIVTGIQTNQISPDNKQEQGKIEAKLMVIDKNSKVVYEYNQNYTSKNKMSLLQINFPKLNQGVYNVMVEVKDLNTWKSDLSGEILKL